MNDIVTIKMSSYGASIGTRDVGAQIRNKVEQELAADHRVYFDFTGVQIISSGFADELFGKLYRQLGRERFLQAIRINGFESETQKELITLLVQKSLVEGRNQ